jgi:hypothetical protein
MSAQSESSTTKGGDVQTPTRQSPSVASGGHDNSVEISSAGSTEKDDSGSPNNAVAFLRYVSVDNSIQLILHSFAVHPVQ